MKKHPLGFTLIELLVVIAIIGTLSSIVLASLSTARDKGTGASIQQQLSDMRTEAESEYGTGSGGSAAPYSDVCEATTKAGTIFRTVAGLTDGTLNSAYCATNAVNDYHVIAGGSVALITKSPGPLTGGWAAAAKLKTGGYYCVDFTGYATTTATLTIGTADQKC